MYPKQQDVAKQLFKCEVRTNRHVGVSILSWETIKEYENPAYRTDVVLLEDLGKAWPKGAEVELLSRSGRNCYLREKYLVTADARLTEEDMEILRAQGCFMGGQETGLIDLNDYTLCNGRFTYEAHSVCDSSD